MDEAAEQIILDFYRYPPVGDDDWRYLSQTAQVRMLEMQLLSKTVLLNMAEAENFEAAAEFLAASEYALTRGGKGLAEVENILRAQRAAVRELFADLMLDKEIVKLFRTRDDFANLRLAVRRAVTKKALGLDYSNEGNMPAEAYEEAFREENYSRFPNYMQEAIERAVPAYYQNKDVRQIDYAIDNVQAEYNLKKARQMKNIFLAGLFRIQIDLTNIRTMLRLKYAGVESRFLGDNIFLKGGYLELERLRRGLETGYEAMGQVFFVTPYYEAVEAGANWFASDKSFLRIEQRCEEHLTGFLKTTIQIVTGPQPIIAYLLMKENEIRTVRLILTSKKNALDKKLILDRLGS